MKSSGIYPGTSLEETAKYGAGRTPRIPAWKYRNSYAGGFLNIISLNEIEIPRPAFPRAKPPSIYANLEPRILTQRQRLTVFYSTPRRVLRRSSLPLPSPFPVPSPRRERLPTRGSSRKQLLRKLLSLRVSPARISNFQLPSHAPLTTRDTPTLAGINFYFLVYILYVDGSCSLLD